MADRPMIFSAPMVRALLAGTKTQTRRVIKPAPFIDRMGNFCASDRAGKVWDWGQNIDGTPCLRNFVKERISFAVGDRLWVRETWAVGNIYDGLPPRDINPGGKPGWCGIRYAATDHRLGIKDRSPIHMPRWASRLTLTVTDVRVERLQDISEADALAEGVDRLRFPEKGDWGWPQRRYRDLWNSLHGVDAWAANPWVVAISFTLEQRNIDAPAVLHTREPAHVE